MDDHLSGESDTAVEKNQADEVKQAFEKDNIRHRKSYMLVDSGKFKSDNSKQKFADTVFYAGSTEDENYRKNNHKRADIVIFQSTHFTNNLVLL